MRITFDAAKWQKTLDERGLDFADAAQVFGGKHTVVEDRRWDYGETRYISAGWLGSRMVVLVWTQRSEARRVISMRYCHADEEALWRDQLG